MTSKNQEEINPLYLFTHILKEQKEDSFWTEEQKKKAPDIDSDQDSDTEEIVFDNTGQVKQEDTQENINITK